MLVQVSLVQEGTLHAIKEKNINTNSNLSIGNSTVYILDNVYLKGKEEEGKGWEQKRKADTRRS